MYKYKLVLLGDSGVGKTSIINRYLYNKFNIFENSTIGGLFFQKDINYKYKDKEHQLKLQIWDTAGQERFRSMMPMYVKDANICLIVFDCSSISNLQEYYNRWYEFINNNKKIDDVIIYLIGTKRDLVNISDISKNIDNILDNINIKRNNICFVSSKTGEYMDTLFNRLIINLHEIIINKILNPVNVEKIILEETHNISSKKNSNNCC
jgi:small GTP-binding protein